MNADFTFTFIYINIYRGDIGNLSLDQGYRITNEEL